MHKALPLFVLAGIGSMTSLSSHAQQISPNVNPTDQGAVRVLTEDQVNTYWVYAQERLSKNDFRTAMATLYFLVNARGVSEEMREKADNALLQALDRQESIKRGEPVASRSTARVAPVKSVPSEPVVVFEEVSTTTVVTAIELNESQAETSAVTDANTSIDQPEQVNEVVEAPDDADNAVTEVTANPEVLIDVIKTTVRESDSVSEQALAVEPEKVDTEIESTPSVTAVSPVSPDPDSQSKVVTEGPVEAVIPVSIDEDQDTSTNTDLSIEFGFSREDTNNNFTDAVASQSSDTAVDISVSLNHNFSPVLSGTLELTIPVSEVESDVGADEIYLQYLFATDNYSGDVIVGTQSISESRGWMFDSTLDLLSTSIAAERWNLTVGLGAETEDNFWSDLFEPEDDPVYRWIGEFTHQVNEQHLVSLLLTGLNDGSALTDDSETDAVWIGARAQGAFQFANEHPVDYWIDVGSVSGKEKVFETSEDDAGVSTQLLVAETDLRGWGYDFGATWFPSNIPGRPEFTMAFAGTSKDSDLSDSTDRGYRQSGLHGNSVNVGRVTDWSIYGLVLSPELSNLRVGTAGVTFPLLSSSYFSIFYHQYQQVSATTELRDSSLDLALTGVNGDVGQAFDVVVGYEESESWSVSLSAGFFEAGKGTEQPGASAYYGLVDFSYDF